MKYFNKLLTIKVLLKHNGQYETANDGAENTGCSGLG